VDGKKAPSDGGAFFLESSFHQVLFRHSASCLEKKLQGQNLEDFMNQRGMSLVEIIVVLVLSGIGTAFALPRLGQAHRHAALNAVTRKLQMNLLRARAEAMNTGYTTALVFDRREGEKWTCSLIQDGDNDGIRRDDIAKGIDSSIGEIMELYSGGASLSFLQDVRIPDPSGEGSLRGDFEDPVRAGASDILSYRPEGTATPATLYISDHHDSMRAIRVYGLTGRVRVLSWKSGELSWKVSR